MNRKSIYLLKLFELLGGLNFWDKNKTIYNLMTKLNCDDPIIASKKYFVEILEINIYYLVFSIVVFCLSADTNSIIVLCLLLLLLNYLYFKKTLRKLSDRKNQIVVELPNLINQWLLRLCTGESVLNVILNTKFESENGFNSPLFIEVNNLKTSLLNGVPIKNALESFSDACSIFELKKIVQIIINYQIHGGNNLYYDLRFQLSDLWELKKNTIRKIGEEASSKLVFPMVIIMFVIMFFIASPMIFFNL